MHARTTCRTRTASACTGSQHQEADLVFPEHGERAHGAHGQLEASGRDMEHGLAHSHAVRLHLAEVPGPILVLGLAIRSHKLPLPGRDLTSPVKDFDTKPIPGQETVTQGVILCERENNVDACTSKLFVRPAWAFRGSFPIIPYLSRFVPHFNNFLKPSECPLHVLTAGLMGARLMGRWKGGTRTILDAYSQT
ncbi:hypothetical protein GSI_07549 [Ganoderma sinense ZZ0214-1]|uniref:Uncharacterized protein n=1 Tax=Ganoderma sinense ZZ0214-1 TaxID=1077348 RepID=A0A2G8S9B8_9APHY|nr:hypothetical protein GSI_07549 [Ganoderma sinense ZZ0214-1]